MNTYIDIIYIYIYISTYIYMYMQTLKANHGVHRSPILQETPKPQQHASKMRWTSRHGC